MDQVPLQFVVSDGSSYDFGGVKRVWVMQPASGLEKRQCTLVLCIAAEGEQPRAALIFRGQSLPRYEERRQYDPRIDVYVQKCAWMDTAVAVQWATLTFLEYRRRAKQQEHQLLLFLDNLAAHKSEEFKNALQTEGRTLVWMGPPGQTHHWQPIDQGENCLL